MLGRWQIYHPSVPVLYLNLNHYTVLKNAKRLRGGGKKELPDKSINIVGHGSFKNAGHCQCVIAAL